MVSGRFKRSIRLAQVNFYRRKHAICELSDFVNACSEGKLPFLYWRLSKRLWGQIIKKKKIIKRPFAKNTKK